MSIHTANNIGAGVAGQYLIFAGACKLRKITTWAPSGGDFPIVYDAASTPASASDTVTQIIPAGGAGSASFTFNDLNWKMFNGIVVELTTSGGFGPMMISVEYEV